MATNDFIGFASSGGANVMSQADFAAAHEQFVGVQPGMASSAMANKVWRQGANMAAVIGELIKNHGIDALDNGDLATLYNALLSATASATLAGLMSAADKIALDGVPTTYFPLSGGALSGQSISRNVTNSALRLLGGTENENGGYISLWGKDTEGDAGNIYAIARTSVSNSATLRLTPSGSFSWRGLEVPYCFAGTATNVSRSDFVNFLVPPPKTPSRIYVFHPSSTPSSLAAYGISKTGFYLGTSTSPVDNVYYIAFCLGGGDA